MTGKPSDKEYQPFTDKEVEEAIGAAFDLVRDFILRERSSLFPPPRDPEGLHADLEIGIRHRGCSFKDLVGKLQKVLAYTPGAGNPRFFNQLFGGRDIPSFLAEMLTPLTNTSMYTYKVAGPQILIERELLRHMAGKVGYPEGEGLFFPGGSLSNFTAMMIARNTAVEGARDLGLHGGGLRLYTSEDGHYSIRKNAGLLGIGRNNVLDIATDNEGRMDVELLERLIEKDKAQGLRPFLVNATAGTTVLGAFDPIPEIARVAKTHGLWLHVDAAIGGSFLLCDETRHLLDGSDLADSMIWNPHKMMGVPLQCSALLLKRRGLLNANLNETAEYLFQGDTDELNPGTRSIQCGRRNDALKLWAAWQYHGDKGYAARIRRQFALARRAVEIIEADPGLELANRPQSICVCFVVRGKSSEAVCERLNQDGTIKVGYGVVKGRRAIRLVTVNPDLTDIDLETFFKEISDAGAAVPESGH